MNKTPATKRIADIDIVRGLVMMLMALDHVRDMLHLHSITQNPTNLETTTPILFFTRWITYLCAPVFVFLAGTSAYLSFTSTRSVLQSRNFLLKRGLYLVVLELVVVNFLLFFDWGFHTFIFEVIAAIGFGFIVLALLLELPVKAIGVAGLAILFCHNLLPLIPFEQDSTIKALLSPLFAPGASPLFSNKVLIVAYPPIPWLGVMLLGFASGKTFELSDQKRKKFFLRCGIVALLMFFLLRFLNIYGDPLPWSAQKNGLYTFLSFMNVSKYPPSLLFCLITLGMMLLILAFVAGAKGWLAKVASVYGKIPLFYFLTHFLLIHLAMLAVMLLQGFEWSQLDFADGTFGRPKGAASGISLGAVYLIWLAIVALLYPACLWFGQYKASHQHWWLKYT